VGSVKTIRIKSLGRRDYAPVFAQMQTFTSTRQAFTPDEIWIVEHNPVFTLGRNGKMEHVLNPGSIPLINTDRGGQVTYHGPGQLVLYILLDIRRSKLGVRKLVTILENSVIKLLANYGVKARSDRHAPGVYVDGKKIAALGLRVSKGRTYHGLSLNVNMDLEPFSRINPCGYADLEVIQCHDLGIRDDLESIGYELSGILLELIPDSVQTSG
jgi:lipoyl(octanoyl) transferase